MEKDKFKKILFKVAFCAMACDGEIQKEEIEELKFMDKNTSYFADIDLSNELTQLVNDFESKGTKVIEELFELLRTTKLNPIQELLVLEIALRIINADNVIDENEVKFINFLRSKLEVYDEIIIDRFGELDILYTNEYSKNKFTLEQEKEFTENIELPEISDLKEIIIEGKEDK
jgi:hypothetical protein